VLQEVGAYEVVRKLGQGGMGAVFEGTHKETRKRVAIKMLLPHLSKQPDVVRRFFNEARAASLIGHAAVVEVFDTGTLPDGAAYLVMEFLDGETLGAYLKQRGRLGNEALPIARDIAAALVMAHQKKIIHRDLKPENVMVLGSPTGLRIKVLDFGIAKIAQDAELAAGMGVRTRTGTVLGTPMYMSPEQCLGSKDVGAPTDVYALGAMLHQLVSGKPPFVGSNVGEMLAMQIYDAPTPLSQRVPGVAPALEKLTLTMLDKKPENRPTMAAVLRTLEQLIAGEEVLGQSPTVEAQAPSTLSPTAGSSSTMQPARHSRVWLGAAAAALVGVGVIVMLATRRPHVTTTTTPKPLSSGEPAHATAPAPSGAPPSTARPHAGTVLWLVKSEPPRADVVRLSDGALLGKTPWYIEQPSGQGNVEVIVRKSGFVDQHATLDRGADSTLHVQLERRPSTGRKAKNAAQEDDLEVKPLR
jgi:serine/threonine protein kinase